MRRTLGRVQVTIQPWQFSDRSTVLQMEAEVNGQRFTNETILEPDCAESLLEAVLRRASDELLSHVKALA